MLVDKYENDFELRAWKYEDRQALLESQTLAEYEYTDTAYWKTVDTQMRGDE